MPAAGWSVAAEFARQPGKVVMRSSRSMSTMKRGCFSVALSPFATDWSSLAVPRWHGQKKSLGAASSKQPPRRGLTESGTILARWF